MNRCIAFIRRHLPLADLLAYERAARRDGLEPQPVLARRFRALLTASAGGRGLQIGARERPFGPNWTVVDLRERSPLVTAAMDVQALAFSAATFDAVVCNAVLEGVADPAAAIRELGRVLKPGGEIWIEVPFVQAHHPSPAPGRGDDYWRVTPRGLRLWMRDFDQLSAGLFGLPFWNGVYFHGRKPRAVQDVGSLLGASPAPFARRSPAPATGEPPPPLAKCS